VDVADMDINIMDAGVVDVSPKLIYVIISVAMFFVSTRIIKAGPAHVFALLLAAGIITHLKRKEETGTLTFNTEMDYRLEMLSNPSHFHLDTNLINLFFSIYGWRKLNPSDFENAVKAANNVLHLREDSEKGVAHCVDNYEVAYQQSRLCMNYLHSMIYSIREPLLVKKLKQVLSRLQQLLERNLVFIQTQCERAELQKPRRDVDSRFIEDAQGPKPFDPYVANTGTSFDVYI
jgi:hypothetical protein